MKNFPIEKDTVLFVSDRKTRKYFVGVDIAEGFLVVENNKITCFADARYFSAVKDKLKDTDIIPKLFCGIESITDYFNSVGVKTVYIDFDKEIVSDYKRYKKAWKNVKDGSSLINKLRSVKSKEELEYTIKACEIVQKAYHTAIKEVKKGITEIWLKDRIESLMMSLGADGIAFDTIVAFGANGAVPHHETGQTVLADDMPILVDVGCTYNGYCSDLTRMAYYGKPSEEFLNAYQKVLNANLIAEQKITAGTSCKKADGFARNYFKKYGLEGYFTHSLGHGVGLDIHEYPTLSKKSKAVLQNQTVFTVEPGLYFDGKFGIRIEDTVILTDGKVERLFTDDKNLIIL